MLRMAAQKELEPTQHRPWSQVVTSDSEMGSHKAQAGLKLCVVEEDISF